MQPYRPTRLSIKYWWLASFLLLAKFCPTLKKKVNLEVFHTQGPEVRGNKSKKNHHIHIFGFNFAARNIEGYLNFSFEFLIYSEIYLSLPRDDDYKQKFLKTH
jgi:hypothetical protein